MNLNSILIFLVISNLIAIKSISQNLNNHPLDDTYHLELNDVNNPCVTSDLYQLIEKRSNENAAIYCKENKSRNATTVTQLNWPLKAATGFNDCSFYYISAQVDQDKATGVFKDYNCGTYTYDAHRGTDIGIVPFSFYKMDHDYVQVVAAAAGTIIDKHDGEFDKNCVGVSSSLTANYLVIQHADGSRALYLHMKKNSLTAKAIGQTVIAGEYLAVVGSSGSSSGPHLHFEVWSGNSVSTYIDPFSGNCNLLNNTSWWANQKPYTEPALLKVSVNTTDIVIPACPATEILNESDTYTIPFQGAGLPAGFAKFYIFLRDPTNGTSAMMSILNPNGTTFTSWTYNIPGTYRIVYSGFSKKLPTIPGIYTFQASYNGTICSHNFEIINLTRVYVADKKTFSINVSPNPFSLNVNIQLNQDIDNGSLIIYNETGQAIKSISGLSGKELSLDRADLKAGLYFVRLMSDNKLIGCTKFVIED